MLVQSCYDKQYFEVTPSTKGINRYGYLDGTEFPIYVSFLVFIIVYGSACIYLGINIYLNRYFISVLHVLFFATTLLDFLHAVIMFTKLKWKNDQFASNVL